VRAVVALIGLIAVALPGSPSADAIDDVVAAEMPASGVPGLAWAVVADDSIVETGARGVLVMGGDREVTARTPFLAGSITKSFTALAVMQLVEAGMVDLDTEIAAYLDGFAGRPAGPATIRQLLSHTSGYSTFQGNTSHTGDGSGDDVLADRVDALAQVTPAHPPGERWEYSNANYLVLGRLVEVVGGQDYQGYVTSRILKPVGMADSFVSDGRLHESMATGHTPWFWTRRPLSDNSTNRAMAPAGGIVSSADDLARYLQMMMNGEDDVLSAEGKALMMRPAGDASPYYGLGWYVDPDGTVWHSGATPGVETLATMVPAERRGVVVLVNGGSGIGFGETAELREAITARALGLEYAGVGSRWSQKALFVGLVLLPLLYLVAMAWAWFHRYEIRTKTTGVAGRFSLFFPLVTTSVAAWVILWLMPRLLGAPLATIRLFQPDFGWALTATAVLGVLWAVFRIGVAYTGDATTA
jgi:CubicO group peptidase (beta-lactamase class C family)